MRCLSLLKHFPTNFTFSHFKNYKVIPQNNFLQKCFKLLNFSSKSPNLNPFKLTLIIANSGLMQKARIKSCCIRLIAHKLSCIFSYFSSHQQMICRRATTSWVKIHRGLGSWRVIRPLTPCDFSWHALGKSHGLVGVGTGRFTHGRCLRFRGRAAWKCWRRVEKRGSVENSRGGVFCSELSLRLQWKKL